MKEQRCKTCRYWDEVDERVGYCRRHAPKIVASMLDQHSDVEYDEAIWPLTDTYSSCGDWAER